MIYQRQPWTAERRERLSLFHRRRWGAPDGFCTIYGIHVPFEHRGPVRYWADWLVHHHGRPEAERFILELKAGDWRGVAKIRDLWLIKKQIGRNADTIRKIVWEAHHAD